MYISVCWSHASPLKWLISAGDQLVFTVVWQWTCFWLAFSSGGINVWQPMTLTCLKTVRKLGGVEEPGLSHGSSSSAHVPVAGFVILSLIWMLSTVRSAHTVTWSVFWTWHKALDVELNLVKLVRIMSPSWCLRVRVRVVCTCKHYSSRWSCELCCCFVSSTWLVIWFIYCVPVLFCEVCVCLVRWYCLLCVAVDHFVGKLH